MRVGSPRNHSGRSSKVARPRSPDSNATIEYWIYDTWDDIVDVSKGRPTRDDPGHGLPGDPPSPVHRHITEPELKEIHLTDRGKADDAEVRGAPDWQNWWDRLKEIVGWVDPTPIGLGISLGEGAAKAIDPWAEEVKSKRQKSLEWWLSDATE